MLAVDILQFGPSFKKPNKISYFMKALLPIKIKKRSSAVVICVFNT